MRKNKKYAIIFLFMFSIISLNAQGIRKHYTELEDFEMLAYKEAIEALWLNGTIAAFADLHARPGGLNIDCNTRGQNNCGDESYIHNDEDFLPWHRQFLLEFEREIKTVHDELTIPYWDWTGESDPSGVNSRSASGPLWANNQINALSWSENFLGEYDDDFNLTREFGGAILPDASSLNSVLNESSFQGTNNFRERLEGPLHNPPHGWVGDNSFPPASGSMSDGFRSPRDPVFYFHHAMVDKIWQIWGEDGNTTNFTEDDNAMPSYSVNPNDIVDSRELGIFYSDAENKVTTLSNYEVANEYVSTEKFIYQFDIVVHDFEIPNGKSAQFFSGTGVEIENNFTVETGATFELIIE